MSDGSRGFCIFYDWLEVFEMFTSEQVGELIMAIGRYYTEGADIMKSVSEGTKPVALMILRQLERAKERKEKRSAQAAPAGNKGEVINTTTETETETKTKTETETNTETETETEKNKETKQNTHAHEYSCEERGGTDGKEGNFLGGGGGSRSEIGEALPLKSVAPLPMPTLGEVEEYVRQNRLHYVNARQFYEYNARRAWTIDGEPIRDWQSVLTLWNSKSHPPVLEERQKPDKPRYGDFDPEAAFERALARSYAGLAHGISCTAG